MTPVLTALRRLGNAGAQDNARRSCEERLGAELQLEAACRRLSATGVPLPSNAEHDMRQHNAVEHDLMQRVAS